MPGQSLVDQSVTASIEDVKRVFGELDETKLLDILALQPTVLDLEEASMSLSGDRDVFGAGEPLQRVAGDIVAILTADEGEDAERR